MSNIYGTPNIPSFYADDDTVYHYTSTDVALAYIISECRLRLHYRRLSNDPIENTDYFFSSSGDSDTESAYKFRDTLKKMLDQVKQVSFCMNKIEHKSNTNTKNWEKYGFAKPRMWDQYGDNYKGVCLAFSRKALEKSSEKANMICEDVRYVDYHNLDISHQSIDKYKIGDDEYTKNFTTYVKKRLFKKHIDFNNENEYRICSFNEGEFDYVDISNALRGVIVTNIGLNTHLYEAIFDSLSKYQEVDIRILNFKINQGLSIWSYDDYNFMKSQTRQLFEKLNARAE